MSYSQMLQVIGATCLVAIPLGLALGRLARALRRLWLRHGARPRYLHLRGVRRRAAAVASSPERHAK